MGLCGYLNIKRNFNLPFQLINHRVYLKTPEAIKVEMTWVVKGAIVATNKMTVSKRHVKGVYRREAMVLMAPKALCCQEVSWKTTDLETAVTHPQNFIRKMYIIIPHFNSSKKVSVISGSILWITGCIDHFYNSIFLSTET